jgi:type IV fimbrial biogenesis protein FimT
MKKRVGPGFTLFELLITIVVVGVILVLGIPTMTEFARNSRMTGTANDLMSSFQLARTEAARVKTNVTICASPNPMEEAANCGGSFATGWIIFIDDDGDLIRAGSRETVLKRFPPPPDDIAIQTNGGANYFSYASSGLGRGTVGDAPALETMQLCDPRGNVVAAGGSSAARFIVVTPLGRANVISDIGQIEQAGGCPEQ